MLATKAHVQPVQERSFWLPPRSLEVPLWSFSPR
ncbi:hypothetical protein CORC01_06808 [Colletotrichum orchidophilum]|uniref:Uncharacterized protein n=1 Tax=Colletotrichum orchidophilum TaxID=1209926 RepID=A0A1G4B9D9_9PEZI|nr:uncharacterized protein CORC01_06808 [Colletotrichum orchidophilum]OHE97945.1 hypothetical protein CORC01_06808 [Colletotrichum orchidophilum]